MNYKRWLISFGILDILIIFNFLIVPFIQGDGFVFYDNALNSIKSGSVFFDNRPYMGWVFLVPHLTTATVLISAPLLILQKKSGAYISIIQSLFRMIGLMMPTFFFISYFPGIFVSTLSLVIIGLLLEAFKIFILFNIIRGNHNFFIKNKP